MACANGKQIEDYAHIQKDTDNAQLLAASEAVRDHLDAIHREVNLHQRRVPGAKINNK